MRNESGFSLAELLIVMVCAAILASAGIPGISHLQKAWTLRGGAMSLESSLQWGRMHAISTNAPMLFAVDDDRQQFYWVDPASGAVYSHSVRRLSPSLRIAVCPKHPLRFYQHGNAAPGGTFTVKGEAGSYSIVVSPGGRIRMQQN